MILPSVQRERSVDAIREVVLFRRGVDKELDAMFGLNDDRFLMLRRQMIECVGALFEVVKRGGRVVAIDKVGGKELVRVHLCGCLVEKQKCM
jgi:hypothetical protein